MLWGTIVSKQKGRFRFFMNCTTAGDAQGQALVAIVHDVPAGLRLLQEQVESDLRRCLSGYQVPSGAFCYVEIESGLYQGTTSGAPVAFLIYGDTNALSHDTAKNLPCNKNMSSRVLLDIYTRESVPCPGRGDLAAMLKTAADSVAPAVERLAARDQVASVVAASLAREFLAQLGVEVASFVTRIGTAFLSDVQIGRYSQKLSPLTTEFSSVRCPDEQLSREMNACVEQAQEKGVTLGGTFQLVVTGLLPGLGDFAQRYQRLNAQLAAALFSLPDVVAVDFGAGSALAASEGPCCHDAIVVDTSKGFSRSSNYAGGLEDGLTSGELLLISVSVAPCAPTPAGGESVHLDTLEPYQASCKNAPTCVVPGVAVAAEAEVAFVLANAYFKQFGSANMTDICSSVAAYTDRLKRAAR